MFYSEYTVRNEITLPGANWIVGEPVGTPGNVYARMSEMRKLSTAKARAVRKEKALSERKTANDLALSLIDPEGTPLLVWRGRYKATGALDGLGAHAKRKRLQRIGHSLKAEGLIVIDENGLVTKSCG